MTLLNARSRENNWIPKVRKEIISGFDCVKWHVQGLSEKNVWSFITEYFSRLIIGKQDVITLNYPFHFIWNSCAGLQICSSILLFPLHEPILLRVVIICQYKKGQSYLIGSSEEKLLNTQVKKFDKLVALQVNLDWKHTPSPHPRSLTTVHLLQKPVHYSKYTSRRVDLKWT